MTAVRIPAFAKVNLSLEVLGKRHDGFHEVRSVLQSISVADDLWIDEAEEISVECDVPDLAGESNLAMRAARDLLDRAGIDRGATIHIRKGIPVAAGLGGASSDAAAVVRGLVALYDVRFQPADLQIVAADLGSDVPFFLQGGAALVEGRGQLVYPLADGGISSWLVLLVPPHSIAAKTASLYRRLTPEMWSSGERTSRLAETIVPGGDVPMALLGNVFEDVADAVFPALGGHRQAMLDAGCAAVHMSGAGPSLFSLLTSEADAQAVASRLSSRGFSPLVARTLTSREACPPVDRVS